MEDYQYWKVLSVLNSYVLLTYGSEFHVLSVLVDKSLVGWYDGFCNSYLSQEEEENASFQIAKWLISVPANGIVLWSKCYAKALTAGQEHTLTLTLLLHAVKFPNKECFLRFVKNWGKKAEH